MLHAMQMDTGKQKGGILEVKVLVYNCFLLLDALGASNNRKQCVALPCLRCELELKKCSALEECKWKGKILVVFDQERHPEQILSVNKRR